MDTTLLELVDAAYELVELYKPSSPSHVDYIVEVES
jgi:hypothetical protein